MQKICCHGLDIWVSEIMEPDVLDPRLLQQLLVDAAGSIRMIHGTRDRRWKHIRVFRMQGVFFLQELDRLQRDIDGTNGMGRLGSADDQFPIIDCAIIIDDRL